VEWREWECWVGVITSKSLTGRQRSHCGQTAHEMWTSDVMSFVQFWAVHFFFFCDRPELAMVPFLEPIKPSQAKTETYNCVQYPST
jgi:hypothetical protein